MNGSIYVISRDFAAHIDVLLEELLTDDVSVCLPRNARGGGRHAFLGGRGN